MSKRARNSPETSCSSLQELWDEQDHFRESILSKLRGYLDTPQTRNMDRCGREKVYRTCKECDATKSFGYHCDLKFCPRCNHRITRKRVHVLKLWSTRISQPKHIVTTQRNFKTLVGSEIRRHQKNLVLLRRSPCFAEVKGGCVSVEITNEDRGWHLHAHWLVDARWVDAGELARTWGRLVGQDEGAVVKVKDVRGQDYVAEVAKYVAKGSEIAAWKTHEIMEFLVAIFRKRFFFTFGTLFKEGGAIRAQLNSEHVETLCDCGCSKFVFRSELDQTLADIRQDARRR